MHVYHRIQNFRPSNDGGTLWVHASGLGVLDCIDHRTWRVSMHILLEFIYAFQLVSEVSHDISLDDWNISHRI